MSIVNGNVVWVSGTDGTFARTTDGDETGHAGTVAGAEKLGFRDVYAADGETTYLLSIGKGNESRFYKTTDAGKNWLLEQTEQNPKAFLSCMAFWDATHGIVVGDPLDGKPELLTTSDGGTDWTPLQSNTIPRAKNGEVSPASGTCIAMYAEEKGSEKDWQAWFVTKNASRVFHSRSLCFRRSTLNVESLPEDRKLLRESAGTVVELGNPREELDDKQREP